MPLTCNGELASLLAEMTKSSGWEGAAARRLAECRSPGDLIGRLRDGDADVRIVAARTLGQLGPALGDNRDGAIQELTRLLSDDAVCSYSYGAFLGEENDAPDSVSSAAREALNQLDPDWTPAQPR